MQVVTKGRDTRSEPRPVPARFLDTVAARPRAPALRWRQGKTWHEMTWAEYAAGASCIATGLRTLGVRRGDRGGLLLRNRPEFHLADLAALVSGAVPVSFYSTSPPDRLAYLAGHCGATVVIVDDPSGFERFDALRERLPRLRHIVVVEDAPSGSVAFDALLGATPADLEAATAHVLDSDLATIIYTSGTTGPPKGAMITHANVACAVDGALAALGLGVQGFDMVSALPMAHVAERVASHYLHLSEGTCVTTCPDVAFLPKYLTEVRPRAFFAVPRLWEKAATLIFALADLSPAGRDAFDRALTVGAEAAALNGAVPCRSARRFEEAEMLLGQVRALVGLDRCEVAVTTAAPISVGVLEFFRSLGVPLSELYGLSEATGPVTWDPVHPWPGDVGRAIPGVEVRLAGDGEVLVRGPTVFAGYLDDPQSTAAVLDSEGWLHTGDLGRMEGERLQIVGREKDLLVTAGGENVAPSGIESLLRSHRLVGEAFVAGDRRPYLVALLTLDPEGRDEFLSARVTAAGGSGPAPAERASDDLVREELARWVAEVNRRVSRVEQVKRFVVLEHDWNADSDELTPTMKVKRQAVLDKFAAEIDRLYC